MQLLGFLDAYGLAQEDKDLLARLIQVWQKHHAGNLKRRKYYEERVTAADVNIGIAVPNNMLDVGKSLTCSWAKKAISTLACRSIFDGFAWRDYGDDETLEQLVYQNNLIRQYARALRAELYHGVTFATLSRGGAGEPKAVVRFHSAETASAIWDGRNAQILAGMAIVHSSQDVKDPEPLQLNLYTNTHIIEITRQDTTYRAIYKPHAAGRPLIEALAYLPDEMHPFGQSRLTEPVMSLCDSYLRERLRMELGAELFTSPQKVIMGANDDAFEIDKYEAYITNILVLDKDKDGDVPSLIELPASSMQPHVEVMRCLAAQFAGATNTPISELGVIHDNPASAQAIYAASEPLVIEAQNLNADNGEALVNIATMMYCIANNVAMNSMQDIRYSLIATFKNPAMPSIVSQADSMVKVANADPGFAGTDVFYEQLGFTRDNIDRIKSEKLKERARQDWDLMTAGKKNANRDF